MILSGFFMGVGATAALVAFHDRNDTAAGWWCALFFLAGFAAIYYHAQYEKLRWRAAENEEDPALGGVSEDR